MRISSPKTILLLAGTIVAVALPPFPHYENRRHGVCQQFDAPISASAENSVFNLTHIDSDITARSWANLEDTRTTPLGAARIIENVTRNKDVVQIASHGGHYDSRYWDAKLEPEEHSYVEAALRDGFPILTYDRLGAGRSDPPDACRVVQATLELDILRELTLMTRNGTFHRAMGAAVDDPLRIIHVGHSYGSFLTSGFIATYPELSDATVLTGYIATELLGSVGYSSWSVQYAGTATPSFNYGPGYVLAQKSGIQNVFFAGDPHTALTQEQLDYGNEIKQPVPVGELASGYKLVGLPALEYIGPIHLLLAEYDFFICHGNCKSVANRTELELSYPKAAALEIDVQLNTGHAFPLHSNASAGFQLTFDFLKRNGFSR